MALFPSEFIGCLVVTFILVRLQPIVKYPLYFLKGIFYFLPPRDDVLKKLNPKRSRKKEQVAQLTPTERLEAMELEVAQISNQSNLESTTFYENYCNLVLMTLISVGCFAISEALHCVRSSHTTTDTESQGVSSTFLLSVLVLTVVYAFQLQAKFGLVSTEEAQMCVGLGLFSIIVAMFTVYVPNQSEILDVNLENAFADLDSRMNTLWNNSTSTNDTILSKDFIFTMRDFWFVLIGTLAGCITAVYGLPSMRFSKAYNVLSTSPEYSSLKKLLFHANMIFPLLVAVLWIKPLSSDLILRSDIVPCDNDSSFNLDCIEGDITLPDPSFITHSRFKAMRLYAVLAMFVFRLVSMKLHLQTFLMEPKEFIVRELHRPGRVDDKVLKEKAVLHFHYFSIVVMMYVIPMVLPLFLALLLKRGSETSMGLCGAFYGGMTNDNATMMMTNNNNALNSKSLVDILTMPGDATNTTVVTRAHELLETLKAYPLATPVVYESIIGFFLFWTSLSWFILTFVGVIYWRMQPPVSMPTRVDRTTKSTKMKKV